jgi:hypothetical protein
MNRRRFAQRGAFGLPTTSLAACATTPSAAAPTFVLVHGA